MLNETKAYLTFNIVGTIFSSILLQLCQHQHQAETGQYPLWYYHMVVAHGK